MKSLIYFPVTLLILSAALPMAAQPLSATDAVALIREFPAPADFSIACPGNTSGDHATQYFRSSLDKIEKAALENQQYQMQFYQKNPMGVRPAATPASRVSAQQQASMDAATSELAQKMLSDPAFAQQFAKMSEQEQQAYITKLLAENGIKPAAGKPNVNTAPVPGTDVEWAEMCTAYTQTAMDMNRWQAQIDLQQQYETKHQEVRDWENAAIQKLPMISFGEYGHDHDPEQVKAINKQAAAKHRDLAAAMLKEMTPLFNNFRKDAQQRMKPLNDAFLKAGYGKNYDFGVFYPTVLGAQVMMFQEANMLINNEISMINEVARWCDTDHTD
ncbi:MAG TPA: hypothetical protein PLO67_11080 [Saprospiraceae bacterium]|nr:hypothetical protein [Saprospiraceae bacterium]HPI06517.1 hypothetical protein [Saprospiraceae bacterium]